MEWHEHPKKCVSCGYLALQPISRLDHRPGKSGEATPYRPNAFYEVDTYSRHRLDLDSHCPEGFVGPIKTSPACFRGVASLVAEIRYYSEEHGGERKATEVVIKQQRNCDSWYPYVDGLSPKEHLFMQRFELLEKHRQEFIADLEKDRRKYEREERERSERVQLQLAERNEQLQTQRDIEQGRITRWGIRITALGLIIAFLQVFTMTKDSLLWKIVDKLRQWLF